MRERRQAAGACVQMALLLAVGASLSAANAQAKCAGPRRTACVTVRVDRTVDAFRAYPQSPEGCRFFGVIEPEGKKREMFVEDVRCSGVAKTLIGDVTYYQGCLDGGMGLQKDPMIPGVRVRPGDYCHLTEAQWKAKAADVRLQAMKLEDREAVEAYVSTEGFLFRRRAGLEEFISERHGNVRFTVPFDVWGDRKTAFDSVGSQAQPAAPAPGVSFASHLCSVPLSGRWIERCRTPETGTREYEDLLLLGRDARSYGVGKDVAVPHAFPDASRWCYGSVLKANPAVRGKALVDLLIDHEGVGTAHVVKTSAGLPSPPLQECLSRFRFVARGVTSTDRNKISLLLVAGESRERKQ